MSHILWVIPVQYHEFMKSWVIDFCDWVKFCHARQQWVIFYLSIWSEDMKKGFSGSMTGSALPVLFITSGSDLGQLKWDFQIDIDWVTDTLDHKWRCLLWWISENRNRSYRTLCGDCLKTGFKSSALDSLEFKVIYTV